ncbi:sporulation protein YqfC [Selenihalanaerobacter shriftii]|uniref:Sporulation protein YqfC n=1 Tax=Selenihalanaerobacter shriftii TaxID=142842 RepID=A0A1T4PXT8_9FIRM|nr:sporulation protein YqfC [Selenihalanaerobacter shriftii]SJZ96344.1 sporulation protein YqfC [Selenihalanaerobacter shriftii]
MENDSIKEKFKNKFADFFELPKDVVLDVPRIALVGNLELNLENHRGVIEYDQEKVRIRIHKGQVIILGKELIIEELSKEEARITGYIKDINFKYY